MGKGAFELACCHLCNPFWCKVHDHIGGGKIGNDSSNGMCIVRAAQLALVTPHYPIAGHSVDPVGQLLCVVLNEQARQASGTIGGTLMLQGSGWA